MLALGDFTFSLVIFYIIAFIGLFVGIFTILTFIESSKILKSPSIKKYKKVSVIIPAFNEADNIERTIRKMLEVDYPKDLVELIAVDDGSTDNTYRILKSLRIPNLKVFTKKNGGKASAINHGLKYATGEYVMVLDADTFAQKDIFKKSLGNFEDPNVMATTMSIRVANPQTAIQKMQYIEYTIMNFMRKLMSFVNAQNVTPAATIFRKSFLDKHGGFDTNNLTEDFEMGMRIHSNQYKVAHVFDTFVETVAPSTFSKLKRQRVRWSYGGVYNINLYKYMINPKYGDLGVLVIPIMLIGLAILPIITVYYALLFLWEAVHGYYLLYLIGFDVKYQFAQFFTELAKSSYEFRYFVLAVVMGISILTYAIATRKTNQKFQPLYIIYFLVYGIMLMYFNMIAFARFVSTRRPKW